MRISELLLPEFEQEMQKTRATLERVPDGRFSWKPHEKSGTMGWLAGHLANIPGWATFTLQQDSIDIQPKGAPPYVPPAPANAQELLSTFDRNVSAAREAISSTSDESFMKPWSLLKGGQTVFTAPRYNAIRGFILNHIIHHRSQLGVYLRLNNIPVPSIYGPSADEGSM